MILEHVGLTVSDLDRSIDFYTQVLGFKLLRKASTNAYLHLEDQLLELTPCGKNAPMAIPSNPDQCEARLHGEVGMTHLGFRVDDIEEAVPRIQQLDGVLIIAPYEFEPQTDYAVEPADEKLRKPARPVGRSHWQIAVFAGPDGIILELVERWTKPSGLRTPYAAESAAGGEYQVVWRRPAGVPHNPSEPRSSKRLT